MVTTNEQLQNWLNWAIKDLNWAVTELDKIQNKDSYSGRQLKNKVEFYAKRVTMYYLRLNSK